MGIVNFRLTHKIALFAPMAIAGLMVISGIFFIQNDVEHDLQARKDTYAAADTLLLRLSAELLENRRFEKDFLLRKDEKSASNHLDASAEARKLMEQLRPLIEDPAMTQKLEAISLGYDRYTGRFAALHDADVALGLNASSGLEGKMRNAVHKIEDLLQSSNDDTLRSSMLMMRRHEKDFIMRRDVSYLENHAAEVKKFKAFQPSRFGSRQNYDAAVAALDAYSAAFQQYAAQTLVEAKLRDDVSSSYAAVEPIFNDLTAQFNDAKAKLEVESEAELNRGFHLVIGLILATVLALSATVLLVGRSISKPIVAITQAMKYLAAGRTDVAIAGQGRSDEIGEMAAAVEVFRANAIANRRLEHESETQRNLTEEQRQRHAEIERIKAEEMRQATSGIGDGLKHLAAGDLSFQLTQPFATDFEALRQDFNISVARLADVMRAVAQSISSIDGGTSEISQSSEDLSRRTEKQAASLEETAAALDQITVNVASSSKRADEARVIAAEANSSAAESGRLVANAVQAIERIEQSSTQISNIIGVIDGIAFQTNLLALNAGVEAARAGDAGRGFAVVAQEVRELAQHSAKAAREIKSLISSSAAEVGGGVQLVRETGDALKTIELQVATINRHIEAIATSAREQSVGLNEVNTAVNQMDQVTQQNAAMVEETNAASATLASETRRLRDLISSFNLCHGQSQQAPAMAA